MKGYCSINDTDTLRFERFFPEPKEEVWDWLVSADKRRRWLASGDGLQGAGQYAELIFDNSRLSEAADNGLIEHSDCAGKMKVEVELTLYKPSSLLAFTWGANERKSEVRFQLTSQEGGTLLELTHVNSEEVVSTATGWHTHLDILSDLLEGKVPASFWKRHGELKAEYNLRVST